MKYLLNHRGFSLSIYKSFVSSLSYFNSGEDVTVYQFQNVLDKRSSGEDSSIRVCKNNCCGNRVVAVIFKTVGI